MLVECTYEENAMSLKRNFLLVYLLAFSATFSAYGSDGTAGNNDDEGRASPRKNISPNPSLEVPNVTVVLPFMAVLDINAILEDSRAAVSLAQQMDALRDRYSAIVDQKEQALRAEERHILEQGANMNAEDLQALRDGFSRRVSQLDDFVRLHQGQLSNAAQNAMNQIRHDVLNIAAQIAEARGYMYVVPAAQLLYYDPSVNITAEALARLNEVLPVVNVHMPGDQVDELDEDDEGVPAE